MSERPVPRGTVTGAVRSESLLTRTGYRAGAVSPGGHLGLIPMTIICQPGGHATQQSPMASGNTRHRDRDSGGLSRRDAGRARGTGHARYLWGGPAV